MPSPKGTENQTVTGRLVEPRVPVFAWVPTFAAEVLALHEATFREPDPIVAMYKGKDGNDVTIDLNLDMADLERHLLQEQFNETIANHGRFGRKPQMTQMLLQQAIEQICQLPNALDRVPEMMQVFPRIEPKRFTMNTMLDYKAPRKKADRSKKALAKESRRRNRQ